jgi:hypothetical protein
LRFSQRWLWRGLLFLVTWFTLVSCLAYSSTLKVEATCFFRNSRWLSTDYMALYLRGQNSSKCSTHLSRYGCIISRGTPFCFEISPSWNSDAVTRIDVYEDIYQGRVVISDYTSVEYVVTAHWTNTQNMNEIRLRWMCNINSHSLCAESKTYKKRHILTVHRCNLYYISKLIMRQSNYSKNYYLFKLVGAQIYFEILISSSGVSVKQIHSKILIMCYFKIVCCHELVSRHGVWVDSWI